MANDLLNDVLGLSEAGGVTEVQNVPPSAVPAGFMDDILGGGLPSEQPSTSPDQSSPLTTPTEPTDHGNLGNEFKGFLAGAGLVRVPAGVTQLTGEVLSSLGAEDIGEILRDAGAATQQRIDRFIGPSSGTGEFIGDIAGLTGAIKGGAKLLTKFGLKVPTVATTTGGRAKQAAAVGAGFTAAQPTAQTDVSAERALLERGGQTAFAGATSFVGSFALERMIQGVTKQVSKHFIGKKYFRNGEFTAAGVKALKEKGLDPADIDIQAAKGLLQRQEKAISAEDFIKDAVVRDRTLDVDDINRKIELSNEFKIDLTPGEATDSIELLADQLALINRPESRKTLINFYRNRREEQIPSAVGQLLDQISPATNSIEAAKGISRTAKAILDDEKLAMQQLAKPFYDEAFTSTVPKEARTRLLQNDEIVDALGKAEKKFSQKFKDLPEGNLKRYDLAKKALDDRISKAYRNGQNELGSYLTAQKKVLTDELDAISPSYKKARDVWSNEIEQLKDISQGGIGALSDISEGNFKQASSKIFNETPDVIARNRDFIYQKSPDAWDTMLREELTSRFDKIGDKSSIRTALLGNGLKTKRLRNAMSEQQWESFNKLMDVVDAAESVRVADSGTALNTNAISRLVDKVGANTASKVLNAASLTNAPSRFADYVKDVKSSKNIGKLAELITSKEGIEIVKDLQGIDPRSNLARSWIDGLLRGTIPLTPANPVIFGLAGEEAVQTLTGE